MTTLPQQQLVKLIGSQFTHFFTLKGDAYQTVGKVSDLCRKISKDIFIVRENNKSTIGYHFHALLRLEKEPRKSWFKKGVHMHLQKIGNLSTGDDRKPSAVPHTLTPQELDEAINLNSLDKATEILLDHHMVKLDIGLGKCLIRARRAQHFRRLTDYMLKDNPWVQYHDYILIKSGKNLALPGKHGNIPQQTNCSIIPS